MLLLLLLLLVEVVVAAVDRWLLALFASCLSGLR